MLTFVLATIAVLIYPYIGYGLALASKAVWTRDRRKDFWTFLLFPLAFARNEIGKSTAVVPIEDFKSSYVGNMIILWPIKVLWIVLACLPTAIINWPVARIVKALKWAFFIPLRGVPKLKERLRERQASREMQAAVLALEHSNKALRAMSLDPIEEARVIERLEREVAERKKTLKASKAMTPYRGGRTS